MSTDGERLDRNWEVFGRLVARSERLEHRGRHEQAAVSAMTAATYAWCNPTGLFASDPLENVVTRLGGTLPPPPQPAPDGNGRSRVLHVTSQLYGTGGHTQMLANWLRLDLARDHHVCVTAQDGRPVPEKIGESLASPDALTLLDRDDRTLMGRAAALRELAAAHDHVVLHIHPNDVIACIALVGSWAARPEVLLVNHADHVFWIGAAAVDRVLNLRNSGGRLTVSRRGIPESRNAVLTRPLHLRPRTLSRDEAKASLGVEPGTVLVVSAADTYKYAAPPGETLLDMVSPTLRSSPLARFHVAGPSPEGDWSVLAEEGLGRAWGLLPDVRTLLEAADVYVDSYPFSSLTSMLEAASLDTPVLTLHEGDDRLDVLGADTPELDDHLVVARTASGLATELSRLLEDPAERGRLGAATGAAVRLAHAGGAWEELVDEVLDAPRGSGSPDTTAAAPRETGPLDRRLLQLMRHTVGQDLSGTLAVMAPSLSWSGRLETAVRLVARRTWRPALLLPAPWARWLKESAASWSRSALDG